LISKDTILEDFSKMNPIQRSAYDIKYSLFNKNLSHTEIDEFVGYRQDYGSKAFQVKILIQIMNTFHFLHDLRHHYLMSNQVEFFYNNIYEENIESK
jgi:hypothetical protein